MPLPLIGGRQGGEDMVTEFFRGGDMRTPEDELVDKFLTLYIFEHIREQNGFLGKTKAQKVIFDNEYRFAERGAHVLNYRYFRWDFGPLSTDLLDTQGELSAKGFLSSGWRPTERARNVLRDCEMLLDENATLVAAIEEITDEWAHVTWRDKKSEFYDRQVFTVTHPTQRRRIAEIPLGEPMLGPVPKERAKSAFKIDEGWLATLDLHFDNDAAARLQEALSSAQGRGVTGIVLD